MRKDGRLQKMVVLMLLCVLVVVVLYPAKIELFFYKAALVMIGATLLFIVDYVAFAMARPTGYLMEPWLDWEGFTPSRADFQICPGYEWAFIFACCRRAFLMAMGGLAMGMGL